MNRAIEVIVGTTGEIQIDAVGFKGPDCAQATKFLEKALGVVGRKPQKPEYHQRSAAPTRRSKGSGQEATGSREAHRKGQALVLSLRGGAQGGQV